MSETTKSPVGKVSKTAWKARRKHDVTLPSGAQVSIVIPNQAAMLKAGSIPNELLSIVLKQQDGDDKLTVEDIKAAAQFDRFLVTKTVVDPEVTEDDLDDLPAEDLTMLVEFATRRRDTDVLGHHLAGLETTEEFKTFRELEDRLADLSRLAGVG
jgi:hypothetical protein